MSFFAAAGSAGKVGALLCIVAGLFLFAGIGMGVGIGYVSGRNDEKDHQKGSIFIPVPVSPASPVPGLGPLPASPVPGQDPPPASPVPSVTSVPATPTPPSSLCGASADFIHAVRNGPNPSASSVVVEGIVMGFAEDGMFVQEEVEDVDSNDSTSEGIFVSGSDLPSSYSVGTVVRLTGRVGATTRRVSFTIESAEICPANSKTIPSATPVATTDSLSGFEHMLVVVTNQLVVADNYPSWSTGQLVLAPEVLYTPTDVEAPLSLAGEELKTSNDAAQFIVEDASSVRPTELSWLGEATFEKPMRLGSAVSASSITGCLDYKDRVWRTVPRNPVMMENDRAEAMSALDAVLAGGPLTVGAFNVLNYFNGQKFANGTVTFDYPENRGARDEEQFELQEAKIVNALFALSATVVGLMEIENDGFDGDSALASLTAKLNKKFSDPDLQYSYVSLPSADKIGSDAITCGLIFRPAAVELADDAWIIDMPRQRFTHEAETFNVAMRPALVQTFTDKATKVNITLAVNHFKSKGSQCHEDYVTTDANNEANAVQSSCNAFRVSAAVALGDALEAASDRIGDRVAIIGDLNAYSQEDPVAVLTSYAPSERGYTIHSADKILADDLEAEGSIPGGAVTKTYGFVNVMTKGFSYAYNGRVGSLDHFLASPALRAEIHGAIHWNINAPEMYYATYFQALQYHSKYEDTSLYRSSDHDPAVAAMRLGEEKMPTLIISEYIEGGSFNKAVELTNAGSTEIDFAVTGYSLAYWTSGDLTKRTKFDITTGTLAPGAVYLFMHNSAAIPGVTADRVVALNFNGDDPVGVLDASDAIVDLLGTFPMTEIIKDLTIRRGSDAAPNPSGFSSRVEAEGQGAIFFPKDTFSGLGCAGTNGCDGSTPTPPLVIGECGENVTLISKVQGSGFSSSMVGDVLFVEGIVTGFTRFGMFIQEEAEDYDSSDDTSEGIFILGDSLGSFSVNDSVRVAGTVKENFGMTALEGPSVMICATSKTVPTPVDVDTVQDALEPLEGMLVSVTNELVVVNTYDTWKYGVVNLSDKLGRTETNIAPPGTALYDQVKLENEKNMFIVEDALGSSNPSTLAWQSSPGFVNPINMGAKVSGIVGALDYSYGEWRTVPRSAVTFEKKRATVADLSGIDRSQLTVASFNVLNYFNGVATGGSVSYSSNARGASSAEQFELQSAKIVNAMVALNASIVGLMEIENDGFGADSALAELCDRLNHKLNNQDLNYTYVTLPGVDQIGSDEITCGILYRPAFVDLADDAWIVEMPVQKYSGGMAQMRPALMQTFTDKETHLNITVAVNHFKSKGSQCYEDKVTTETNNDVNDIQSSCNAFRVSAAIALGDALEAAADRVGERVAILGDLNAYTEEDPVAILTSYDPTQRGYTIQSAEFISADASESVGSIAGAAVTKTYGFTNVVKEGFSYVWDGKVGSLDHFLATEKLAAEVRGAVHWNINSIELYQETYFQALGTYGGYESTEMYRSSDHDPVLVSIELGTPEKPKLVISEYVEGSGNNKAVEIANIGDTTIDFTATPMFLAVFRSGDVSSKTKYALTGILNAGETLIVAHGSAIAVTDAGIVPDLTVGINFNGDDSVALLDAADNITDLVGALPMPDQWMKDMTLRRDPTRKPNPNGFETQFAAEALGWQHPAFKVQAIAKLSLTQAAVEYCTERLRTPNETLRGTSETYTSLPLQSQKLPLFPSLAHGATAITTRPDWKMQSWCSFALAGAGRPPLFQQTTLPLPQPNPGIHDSQCVTLPNPKGTKLKHCEDK
eukprot:gene5921-9068_t